MAAPVKVPIAHSVLMVDEKRWWGSVRRSTVAWV